MSRAADDAEAFAQLARLALSRWDLAVTGVRLIKVRENAVFRVDCEDGGRAVLRVHRPHYHSDAELRSEFEWTTALADSGLRVPRCIPSRRGQPFERVCAPALDGERQVDLLEWVDGTQLGSVEEGVAGDDAQIASRYALIGETAARMHNQAGRWQAGAGFVRHSWCEAGLAGESPLWGRFWELEALDDGQRQLLSQVRDALREDLAQLGKHPSGFGLIHADLVPENLLVEGDAVHVIDFDDAGYGWHLFEIATSLYFLLLAPSFQAARDAMVEGYRRQRSLPEAHLLLLPMFLAARGTTYLGWVHERKNTETARELTPLLIELACAAGASYLRGR